MNGAPFSHLGGAILADHGALSLAEARGLAMFYAREACFNAKAGAAAAALTCADRAVALNAAVDAALAWRRAAGWRNPEDADLPPQALDQRN